MKILFDFENKSVFGELQSQVSEALCSMLSSNKDFSVEFSEVKQSKSYKQLKGLHKLAQLLAIRLSESNKIKYSMENAKDWIKWTFDFTEQVNEEEAIAEAINEKNKAIQSGAKMTREQFLNLVSGFKTSLKKPRSFATATKEEMIDIIEKIHAKAKAMGWNEVKLTSVEMEEMIKFYESNK